MFVRASDGSLRRPEPTGQSPDFSGGNDGALVLVAGGEQRDVGVYLMAGDDTDPPMHYAYDVELYELNDALMIRTIRWETRRGEVVETRVSDDHGRTWRMTSAPRALDGALLLDRIGA
jgi:hypothetical protein